MCQLDDPGLDLPGGAPGTVDDVRRQTGLFQLLDHAAQTLFAASRGRTPDGLPAALTGNAGDDIAIGTFADHKGWIELPVVPEWPYGGKELLVPGAKEHPLAPVQTNQPGILIFQPYSEGQTVKIHDPEK